MKADYRPKATGYRLQATGYRPKATGYSQKERAVLTVARCLSPVAMRGTAHG
jgi:hypothetical protein